MNGPSINHKRKGEGTVIDHEEVWGVEVQLHTFLISAFKSE
jgi:hypothetical protein